MQPIFSSIHQTSREEALMTDRIFGVKFYSQETFSCSERVLNYKPSVAKDRRTFIDHFELCSILFGASRDEISRAYRLRRMCDHTDDNITMKLYSRVCEQLLSSLDDYELWT